MAVGGKLTGSATLGITTLSSCTTVLSSYTITCGSTTGLAIGNSVTGTNIPANTVITSIVDSTHFTISNYPTVASTSNTLTIGANLTIATAAGVEATAHNIYYSGAVSISVLDGSVLVPCMISDSSAGGVFGYCFNVNYTHNIIVSNAAGATITASWDGVQTL